MARETRAAANAASSSTTASASVGSEQVGAGTKRGPSSADSSPSRKRRRPTEGETNGDIALMTDHVTPPSLGEQPRRLKVVLKMKKDGVMPSSSPEKVAQAVTGSNGPPSVDAAPMEDVQASTLEAEKNVEMEDKSLSRNEKKALLAVMKAMQITLSSTTSHTVNTLVDVPLPSRPPITAEKKSKKGKKGKGKDKAVEVAVEHGEWTIRKALEGDHAISIDDVESYLSELADIVAPNSINPFRSGPSSIPSSSRAPPTPLSDYFTALRSVLSSLNDKDRIPLPTVRWALHQRLPTHAYGLVDNQGTNQVMKDWFSSLIISKEDLPLGDAAETPHRDTRSTKVEDRQMGDEAVVDDESYITRLVKENQLGLADPVMVAPTDSVVSRLAVPGNALHVDMKAYNAMYGRVGPPVTLGQSLLKAHASRKVTAWRRRRERGRYVGWRGKAVTFPQSETSFTPSFAPTFDSSGASGGWGYESTLDALHTRSSNRAWLASAWGLDVGRDWPERLKLQEAEEYDAEASSGLADREELEECTRQVLAFAAGVDNTSTIDPALIDSVIAIPNPKTELQRKLDQNNKWMAELMAWQDIRVRRGQDEVLDEREKETAARVAQSLQELAALTTPFNLVDTPLSSLPPNYRQPLAVALAEAVISTPAPFVRGTLDPKRPRALIDNHTAQLKPNALALARPPQPAPRPGMNGTWPRPPGYPAAGPQMQTLVRPQYPPQMPGGMYPGYGQKVPYPPHPPHPMYGPPPNGMYGSPPPRPPPSQPSPRNPLTAGPVRGIGAGMGLSLQTMSPSGGQAGYPQRGSTLRGEIR